jgi:hypothetical protein
MNDPYNRSKRGTRVPIPGKPFIKRAQIPRERRGYRLRMRPNGSGTLTLPRYILESIGLVDECGNPEAANLSHVAMELSIATDPETGTAYVRVETFDPKLRRAAAALATRYNESDAWALVPFGKQVDGQGQPIRPTPPARQARK